MNIFIKSKPLDLNLSPFCSVCLHFRVDVTLVVSEFEFYSISYKFSYFPHKRWLICSIYIILWGQGILSECLQVKINCQSCSESGICNMCLPLNYALKKLYHLIILEIYIFPPVGGMKLKLCVYFLPEIAWKIKRLNQHITLEDHVTLYMRDL